jgi:hypothetical protein
LEDRVTDCGRHVLSQDGGARRNGSLARSLPGARR